MKYFTVVTMIALVAIMMTACSSYRIEREQHLEPIRLNPYGSYPIAITGLSFPSDSQYVFGPEYKKIVGREFLPAITFDQTYFTTAMQSRLREFNYVVIGDENDPFSDDSNRKVDYKLGGVVQSSHSYDFASDIIIEWQLYDANKGEIIKRIITRGYGRSFKSRSQIIMNAFDVALDNLLADREFTEILIRY